MIKGVIFDMDGTLIDSVDLHAQAWQEIFRRYGVETDFRAVRDQIGKGGDKLMRVFLSPQQIALQGKQIEQDRAELFARNYRNQVKAFPRLKELFECLRADGIKIALGSSAKDDELGRYKEISGIGPYLDASTSSDDVAHSKPDPDIFRAARKKLGLSPSEVLVVGDTPYDAESAGKDGIATVGVLCGGFAAETLSGAGCVALYRDPADLLENYALSPFRVPPVRARKSAATKRHTMPEFENGDKRMRSESLGFFLLGVTAGALGALLVAPAPAQKPGSI